MNGSGWRRGWRRQYLAGAALLAAAGWGGGCAKIEPRPDFEQVSQRVGEAVGVSVEPAFEDEAKLRETVEQCLEAGLSAEDAVRVCLLNNPALAAAYARVGMARADLVQSGLFRNPMLATALRLPDEGGLANIMVDLSQNIVDLWQLPVRRRASEAALSQAILDSAREIVDVAIEAQRRYYEAVAAKRLHEITLENLAIARRLLETAIARQEAGAGSAVEVNLARSEVLGMELEARNAALDDFQSRSDLSKLLGLTRSPEDLNLTESLPEPADFREDVEGLLALGEASRLDVLSSEHRASMAMAELELERLKVFPSVELGISFDREARERGRDTSYLKESARASLESQSFTLAPWGKSRRQGEMTMLGPMISMELPVFDQNQAMIARSYYAWREACWQRDAVRRGAVQEIRSAHEQARIALVNVRFYEDQLLPLRQQNLELSRDGYRAGKTPFLDVLEAQRNLLTTRASAVEAQRDAALRLTDLVRVVGRPLPFVQAEVPQPTGAPDREMNGNPEEHEP